jgi:hypothetical protein
MHLKIIIITLLILPLSGEIRSQNSLEIRSKEELHNQYKRLYNKSRKFTKLLLTKNEQVYPALIDFRKKADKSFARLYDKVDLDKQGKRKIEKDVYNFFLKERCTEYRNVINSIFISVIKISKLFKDSQIQINYPEMDDVEMKTNTTCDIRSLIKCVDQSGEVSNSLTKLIVQTSEYTYNQLTKHDDQQLLLKYVELYNSIEEEINKVHENQVIIEKIDIQEYNQYDIKKCFYANWFLIKEKDLYNSWFNCDLKKDLKNLRIDEDAGIDLIWISNNDVDKLILWSKSFIYKKN